MTKTKPRISANKQVHRPLVLVSPQLEGPDVKEFQKSVNSLLNHYRFDWRLIQVDGDYGIRTKRAAQLIAWRMGLSDNHVDPIRSKRGIVSEATQRLIRNPTTRGGMDREREEGRAPKARKLIEKHNDGVQKMDDWFRKNLGVNEEPAFSNHGPYPIDECQAFYGLEGAPWCGCLTGFGVEKIAGVTSVDDVWFPHSGSIRREGEAGIHGIHDINVRNAKRGAIATGFNGGDDHVMWIREDVVPNSGKIFTFEGNTSAVGQNSDGGIIAKRERSFSELTCVVVIEDWV